MPKIQNVQNDCSQPDKTDVQPDKTDFERLQLEIESIKTAQRLLQEKRVSEKLARMNLT